MIYVSEIQNTAPEKYRTALQEKVYQTLKKLNIPFERVDTDEAITMEDCMDINKKLDIKIVKTLFLCNRQQTSFYLFITTGEKTFCSKAFSKALNIARVSFAPAELMETMLGTKLGATTIFSCLADSEKKLNVVFDKEVMEEEWYGCSDGTTTGYMKIHTDDICHKLLPFTKHVPFVIEV